jgi:hypothetical protein
VSDFTPSRWCRRFRVGALLLLSAIAGVAVCAVPADNNSHPTVLIVVGAPGEATFGDQFTAWAGQWQKAAQKAGAQSFLLGLETNTAATDRDSLEKKLAEEQKESPHELWLVLIGHGTFDGREAKFNLRGPDLTSSNLVSWLKPFKRPLAIIDASSSSSPFLKELSASGRVLITATRSGTEQNFARLGQYLAEAIADPTADLDKDGQTSLLEAWLMAARRTADFYQTEARLATEHSLLDDNGDGLGTPADWFRGVRAVKRAKEGTALDGLRAHQLHLVRSASEEQMPPAQRAWRDQLEREVAALRDRKSQMDDEDYYQKLESLLVQMAELYEAGDKMPLEHSSAAP